MVLLFGEEDKRRLGLASQETCMRFANLALNSTSLNRYARICRSLILQPIHLDDYDVLTLCGFAHCKAGGRLASFQSNPLEWSV